MSITLRLIEWYKNNARDLPWRQTKDPYLIWLSEVILQQTRVNQALPYYHRFIERFPDVYRLASASEEEVLKAWQGLGYYSRARNLHAGAKQIVTEYGGKLPLSRSELLKVKGIGPYTAAAIASIAGKQPVPVLDGNTLRVYSRLFAIEEPIDKVQGRKKCLTAAESLILAEDPGTFNQAVMELGALICIPRNPLCMKCPIAQHCMAFELGIQLHFPIKSKRIQPVPLDIHYLVVVKENENDTQIVLRKRHHGFWKNLYDFPEIESEDTTEEIILKKLRDLKISPLPGAFSYRVSGPYRHQLTHLSIRAYFHIVRNIQSIDTPLPEGLKWVKLREDGILHPLPVPRLIEMFLKSSNLWDR